jgi:hypothetical protein
MAGLPCAAAGANSVNENSMLFGDQLLSGFPGMFDDQPQASP